MTARYRSAFAVPSGFCVALTVSAEKARESATPDGQANGPSRTDGRTTGVAQETVRSL